MEKIKAFFRKALPIVSPIVLLLTFILFVFATKTAGGSVSGVFAFPLACLLLCLLPGLALASIFAKGMRGGARICAGFVMGGALLVLSYAAFASFAPLWVAAIPSLCLAVYYLLINTKNIHIENITSYIKAIHPALWTLLLIFCGAWLLHISTALFIYARPAAVGGSHMYHQDLAWSVGNAAAVQLGFPLVDIHMIGGTLNYHYFSDALTGLLAYFSMQPTWDAWCYLSWPVLAGTLMLGLYSAGRRLGASPWLSLVAPAGAFLLNQGSDVEMLYVYVNQNAVLNCYVFLTAAVLMLLFMEKSKFRRPLNLVAFALCMTALIWAKSTIGALLLCAVAAAFIVWSIVNKSFNKGMLFSLLTGGGVFAVLYFSLISKAKNTVSLMLDANKFKESLVFLVTEHSFLIILYFISVIFSLLLFKKLSFVNFTLHAFVLGGFFATSILYHYAKSQWYFIQAAVFVMWLCFAAASPCLFQNKQKYIRRASPVLVSACCALSFVFSVPVLKQHISEGGQSALRCLGLRPPFADYVHETYFAPSDEEAALWLKENMDKSQCFAINRTSRQLEIGDGVFFMYTAFSERQAYTEGWFYSHQYSHTRLEAIHILEEVSDVIFAFDSFEDANRLAAENGISYLVVYKLYKPEGFAGEAPVFENESNYIYKVQPV